MSVFRNGLKVLVPLAALGLGVFWVASAPHPLTDGDIPPHTANLENGRLLYNIGGCISCHAAGPELQGVAAEVPAGGKPLKTPIGLLYPPNITFDKATGLGLWTDADFVNAMQKGIGKEGEHLIPAFPYTSYTHMSVGDVLDIKAYLASLPVVANSVKPHAVTLLPVVRRGLGLWKWIGLDESKSKADPAQTASWNRGSYLVNGAGHCNECHTPRTVLLNSDFSQQFRGGPHPEGKGKVPSLHGLIERGRYKDVADLVLAFQNGDAMGYGNMASGGMGEVQSHIATLPDTDVQAIADYITSFK